MVGTTRKVKQYLPGDLQAVTKGAQQATRGGSRGRSSDVTTGNRGGLLSILHARSFLSGHSAMTLLLGGGSVLLRRAKPIAGKPHLLSPLSSASACRNRARSTSRIEAR